MMSKTTIYLTQKEDITRLKTTQVSCKWSFIIDAPAQKLQCSKRNIIQITWVQPLTLPMHEVFNKNLKRFPCTLGNLL